MTKLEKKESQWKGMRTIWIAVATKKKLEQYHRAFQFHESVRVSEWKLADRVLDQALTEALAKVEKV